MGTGPLSCQHRFTGRDAARPVMLRIYGRLRDGSTPADGRVLVSSHCGSRALKAGRFTPAHRHRRDVGTRAATEGIFSKCPPQNKLRSTIHSPAAALASQLRFTSTTRTNKRVADLRKVLHGYWPRPAFKIRQDGSTSTARKGDCQLLQPLPLRFLGSLAQPISLPLAPLSGRFPTPIGHGSASPGRVRFS